MGLVVLETLDFLDPFLVLSNDKVHDFRYSLQHVRFHAPLLTQLVDSLNHRQP